MIRKIITNSKDLKEEFSSLNKELVSWDTETTSLQQDLLEITGVSFCDGEKCLYVVVDSSLNVNNVPSVSVDEFVIELKKLFLSIKRQVAHNWVFDARVVSKYGVDVTRVPLFDTMIAAHLVDENQEVKLKTLASKLLKVETTTFDEVGMNHYSKEFYEYGLNDAYYTYELYNLLYQELKSKGLLYLMFKVEMPYQLCLLEMSLEGVVVDKKLLVEQQELLLKVRDELLVKMCEEVGVKYQMQFNLSNNNFSIISPINFGSSQQLIKIFGELNIPIVEVTDKGNLSVGKLTLMGNKDHPFVNLLIRYKIVTKLLEGFLEPLPFLVQSDGKVRPYFNDVGARTGRLACSKPNLQQLPKPKCYSCGGEDIVDGVCGSCKELVKVNVRSVFTAPPGMKMFSVDYSGQEVAVMAQQSKDEGLLKILNKGYDMHLAIANQFYNLGVPEDCLMEDHPEYFYYRSKFSKERGNAKTITFGLAYGKSSFGFSKDFGISEVEAQAIVDDYFNGFPGLKKAIDDSHEEVKVNGFVRNLAGRYRHFTKEDWGGYSSSSLRQAFNFKIQGFSADMIRVASINVYRRKKYFPNWGLKQVMTVHDENVYIVNEEYVAEASAMVKRAFEDVCNKFLVKVSADVEVGDNYGNSK